MALGQFVQSTKRLLVQPQLHFFIAQPLNSHSAGRDLHVGDDAIGIQRQAERQRRRDLAQPQAESRHRLRRQHRHDGFRQIQGGAPLPCFPIGGAVRWHQGGGVGDMHPQAVAVQAERIVGIEVAFIVDGVSRQPGQIQARFVWQFGQIRRRHRQRRPDPSGIGVDRAVPIPQAQQQTMGAFRILAAVERLQHSALLALAPGHLLDFVQKRRILGGATSGASAVQKLIPGFAFGRFRLARRPFPRHLRQRPDRDRLGRALEIQTFVQQPPSGPGGGGRVGTVDQFRQIGQGSLFTLQQLAGRFHLARWKIQLA